MPAARTLWWANTTVFNTTVSTFLCPSDGRQLPQSVQMSVVNYGGNYGGPFVLGGYSGTIIPMSNPGSNYTDDPLIQTATTIGLQAILDGTSNTSMWSEMLTPPATNPVAGGGGSAEKRVFFRTAGPVLTATPDDVVQFLAQCQSIPPGTPAQRSTMGYQWWSSFPDYVNSNYNHVGPPNSRQCQNNPVSTSGMDIYGTASPNSNHYGGVNMCMADGSVRFVKDTINLQTWWALGTRAGREIIDADSY